MRKRNLSEFMCIEMLYDYKLGKLDPLRHQAVEEGLQASPRVREEFKKLSSGISYSEKLKGIAASDLLIDKILNSPRTSEKIFLKFRWSELPQPVRWATEAVVVAIAIALFVTQVPDLFRGNRAELEAFVVKKFDVKPEDAVLVEAPATAPTAEAIPEKPEPKVTNATSANIVEKEKIPAKPLEKPKKGNAYVYRGVLYINNVDKVTPEIVMLIKNLEGEKAGEVELGWRRKGGSYFHFMLPQKNTAAFEAELKKMALSFNLVKSPHSRVMPEGTERFIIWVEDSNASGESAAGASMGAEENKVPEPPTESIPPTQENIPIPPQKSEDN